MTFADWVAKELKKVPDLSKTRFLREFGKKVKVSLVTLQVAERGGKIRRYDKAKAVSEGTGGKVSVYDLCDEK